MRSLTFDLGFFLTKFLVIVSFAACLMAALVFRRRRLRTSFVSLTLALTGGRRMGHSVGSCDISRKSGLENRSFFTTCSLTEIHNTYSLTSASWRAF
jgi:hypothetical protein